MNKIIFIVIILSSFFMEGIIAQEQKSVQLSVDGISCGGCLNRIKKDLSEKEGYIDLTADLEKKLVVVNYDASLISSEQIKKAISTIAEKFKVKDFDPNEIIERTVSFKVLQVDNARDLDTLKDNFKEFEGIVEITGDLDNKTITFTYDANKARRADLKDKFKTTDYCVTNFWPNEIVKYYIFKSNSVNSIGVDETIKILKTIPGIIDISVSSKNNIVSLAYNSQKLDEESLLKSIKNSINDIQPI